VSYHNTTIIAIKTSKRFFNSYTSFLFVLRRGAAAVTQTNTTNEQANAVIMRVNNVTRDFAMGGVFHGAVEVNGKEWSYGYCDAGSGVYACLPKLNPQYTYRESIPMGVTALSLAQVRTCVW
jgi:hypothetical protein